jgi:hypothetical protein
MPRVPNHWLLMGVSAAGLLVILLPALRRPEAERTPALRDALAPIRVQIGIVYLWAAFHKLNAGFFDPAGSCAAYPLTAMGLEPGPGAVRLAAALALVAEGSLPFLLWCRRTRTLALLLGWCLHLVLGFRWAWDFSAVATAYYTAFAPGSLFLAFYAWRRTSPRLERACAAALRFASWRLAYPLLAALLAGSLALGALLDVRPPDYGERYAAFVPWLVAWLVLGAGLARLAAAARGIPEPYAPRAALRPVTLVTAVLVAANGTSPYLGLGTEHVFSMFSNLRTEAGEWNHWLVPREARAFGFQDELVRVIESDSRRLRREAADGLRLIPFELRRWASWNPDARIVYARGGREVRAERAGDDPFLAPPNPVLAKLIRFRSLPPEGVGKCLH